MAMPAASTLRLDRKLVISMRTLFVSHEVAPFAKVGGLADVAGSLPKSLRDRGHDVRVIMPAYAMVLSEPSYGCQPLGEPFAVAIGPGNTMPAQLYQTEMDGVPLILVGGHPKFAEAADSASVYLPGYEQHLFFSRAALEACKQLDWIPDVVHCNDWHTGLIPVFMRESGDPTWDGSAAIFTIHNLAYQGEFGVDVLDKAGLPRRLFNHHQLETYGSLNFLKAGCAYADRVNTVSERYAYEIQGPEFGCRLDGLMRHLDAEGRLTGILNGIDQDVFDPGNDPLIPAHYSASDLEGKRQCKRALCQEVGLPADDLPLLGVVTRLSSQKGVDLLLEIADSLLDTPCRLIVQGLGDPWLAERLSNLEQKRDGRFKFANRFDARLAQRVYAGCDIFLMPSLFEPCGLGQMIAMRYGTIPVVRETGGLADTVTDGMNGFRFKERDPAQFLDACRRAIRAYRDPVAWNRLVTRAMAFDSSWNLSAVKYEAMYEAARQSRQAIAA